MEQNPYQTPSAEINEVVPGAPADAVRIRQEHISHEASIRSIGILYYIGAVMLALVGLAQAFVFGQESLGIMIGLVILFLGLAALYFWMGSALRALRSKVRHVAGVFAVLGLAGFPIGTLINAYILYLLYSQKGKMVFSEEYQAIVKATPGIKYKTSVVVWVLLILLVLFFVVGIISPMFMG